MFYANESQPVRVATRIAVSIFPVLSRYSPEHEKDYVYFLIMRCHNLENLFRERR